jgi:guanylate kinase
MPSISPELQRRITKAQELLFNAEKELEAALKDLKVEERPDKRMINSRLETAFEKLAAGKSHLELILSEKD